jgi:O-antigen/teichoic acid export membrane protein
MGNHPNVEHGTEDAEHSRAVLFVAKGGSFLAAGRAFDYISRAVTALVLARVLGAEQYGLYNIGVSVAFVFSGVADLGLDASMERFLAVQRRRGEAESVRGTIQVGLTVTVIASVLIAIGVALFSEYIAKNVFDNLELTVLIQIVSLTIPILALTNLLSAVSRGFKRMDHSAFAYDFIQPLVRLLLILALALFGLNALTATIIFGVSYLAALGVLMYLVPTQLEPKSERKPVIRDTGALIRFGFPFWFTSVLTKLKTNIQALLLGVFNTVTSVGVFSLAGSANLIGRIATLSIATSSRPVIAELFEDDDLDGIGQIYKTTTRWTLTLNLPIFLVMVAFPDAVLRIFGESFVAGASALVILASAELINAGTGTCGAIIDMSGRGLMKVINKGIMVALLIGANLALIPPLGVQGAALAVLVGAVAINVIRVSEIWWFARIQPYNWMTLKPLAASAVGFGVGVLTNAAIPAIDGFGNLVVNAAAVFAGYVGALIILRLPDEERLVIRSAVRRVRKALPVGR